MISTCKAVVSESSDDSNQALGLAVISVAWGTGYIVGPAVSGAIADPIGQYNLNITSELDFSQEVGVISLNLIVKLSRSIPAQFPHQVPLLTPTFSKFRPICHKSCVDLLPPRNTWVNVEEEFLH